MPASRSERGGARSAGAALLGLVLAGAAPALAADPAAPGPPARLGAPLRLTPPPRPAQPADLAAPEGASTTPPIVVAPLAPVSPDWAGPLGEASGGFPATLWQGTPRALVAALLPRLAPSEAPALRDLARRLLLSNAAAPQPSGPPPAPGAAASPPGADDQDDLFALRLDLLVAAGQLDAASALIGLAPAAREGEGLARRAVAIAFLSGDQRQACDRVLEAVRRYQSPWWSRALITCQALAGDGAKAQLGLDMLAEQKAPKDAAFDTLVLAAGGRKVKLERLADPSPFDAVLLAAAKLPPPADALAGASPAVLRFWAGAEGVPAAARLAAAERAAALGALPLDDLRALYGKVELSAEDRANPLSRGAALKGPQGRALLYTAAARQPLAPARAELLQGLLAAARKENALPLVTRLIEPLVAALKPSGELAWFAGDAARTLFYLGQRDAAQAWLASADPATAQSLFAVARLALGRDGPAWSAGALAAAGAGEDAGAPGRLALALALLGAFEEPVGPADWAPLAARLPLVSLDLPGPSVWFDLPRAAAGRRLGDDHPPRARHRRRGRPPLGAARAARPRRRGAARRRARGRCARRRGRGGDCRGALRRCGVPASPRPRASARRRRATSRPSSRCSRRSAARRG